MTQNSTLAHAQDNGGGATPPFVAGKNLVINGNYDIWQRGTTFASVVSAVYTADRFTSTTSGTGINSTVTQDTSVPNANSIYSMKYTQTGGAASVVEYATRYWPETQDAMRLAGKTVTLSFWYKSNKTGTHGARMSNGSQTGGADSSVGFNVVAANTWQYITWTTAVPYGSITAINTAPNAGIGILDIGFRVGGTGVGFTSIASGDYFQISQLQLEIGSTATPFSRSAGTIQGELAACQRYFNLIASGVQQTAGPCYGYSSARTDGTFTYPAMRTSPTLTITTGTGYYVNGGAGGGSFSTFTALYTTTQNTNWYSGTTSTTIGYGGFLYTNNASASIALSAEL
jgi:hypothetical protein